MMRLRLFSSVDLHAMRAGEHQERWANTVDVRLSIHRTEPAVLEEWDEHKGGWFPVPIVRSPSA